MFRPVLLASLLLVCGAPSLFAAEPATDLATVPPVVAAEPKGELLDKVAAVVNDSIVTESEVTEQITMITARLEEQKTQMPPADVIRRQVLDRLIIQEIQLQRAERLGMKVSDEQLNAAIGDIARRNNLQLAQLPDALRAQGIDYQSYRENVRKEITLTGLRQREVLGRINVTPRELDQFLERLKKLPSETSEYNISHILIAVPQDANQAQVDELERRANEVYERASGAEDFSRLAVAYSNSQTALEGGALGWRKGPELPTFLAELVVGLKSGEISKPMRTPNGFHLVKLNEMRSTEGDPVVAQTHARHILMRPNELQDDATVRQRLEGIRERIQKGEEFAPLASSLSEDSASSVNGGDLGWSGPGSFVPEFESVLSGLKENEISEPFRTQFGWHIVQLLGRRQFDTTEDNLRQRAYQQLRESKADEETETWMRRMRDEAFVNTDV